MPRILVIGGAGYVGSHAVDLLIERGYQVFVLDNLITGHRHAVHADAVFIEGEVRDGRLLDDIFSLYAIDGVMHFAAFSLVGESVHKPLYYFDNNVYGMISLLKGMKQHNVRHIIFSSTAAVYGNVESELITEEMPPQPESPYGESKLMMEKIMDWSYLADGINYISLRYFNVCGAKQNGDIGEDHRPETHLIPIVLEVALGKRDKVGIFGDDYPTPDGTCIRDYIHVTDLVEAHLLAMEHLMTGKESKIINLGSSQGFSVNEIIEAARQVTGHPIPAIVESRRAGDPASLVASSRKAKEMLNWEPKITDIHEIIESAWVWFEKYPDGY